MRCFRFPWFIQINLAAGLFPTGIFPYRCPFDGCVVFHTTNKPQSLAQPSPGGHEAISNLSASSPVPGTPQSLGCMVVWMEGRGPHFRTRAGDHRTKRHKPFKSWQIGLQGGCAYFRSYQQRAGGHVPQALPASQPARSLTISKAFSTRCYSSNCVFPALTATEHLCRSSNRPFFFFFFFNAVWFHLLSVYGLNFFFLSLPYNAGSLCTIRKLTLCLHVL